MAGARKLDRLTEGQVVAVAKLEQQYGSAKVLPPGEYRDQTANKIGCHWGPKVCIVEAGGKFFSYAPPGNQTDDASR